MSVDLSTKTLDALKTILTNHETKGKTTVPSYKAALAELGKRVTSGLSLDRTVAIIAEAAARREFLTYKMVAAQSGVKFTSARVAMSKHLLAVCQHAHRKGLPMLSAIVVSQEHAVDGGMDEATLAGFCKAASALKIEVSDPAAFLKEQQEAVFAAGEAGKIK